MIYSSINRIFRVLESCKGRKNSVESLVSSSLENIMMDQREIIIPILLKYHSIRSKFIKLERPHCQTQRCRLGWFKKIHRRK